MKNFTRSRPKLRSGFTLIELPAMRNLRPCSGRVGFTLIELLVVVTIIVVLLALLVPALDKAVSAAELAKCSANLHGIDLALFLYLNDSKRTYPVVSYWNGLLGNAGTTGYKDNDSNYNGNTDERPLNKYLGISASNTTGKVGIAQCPADHGESLVVSDNCYRDWGTSYVAYIGSLFRIKAPFGFHDAPPMRAGSIVKTSNKVILPEWPTVGNRPSSDPRNIWHREPDRDNRYHNVLFADSHAELFGFNIFKFEVDNAAAPDPNWAWW